MSRTAPFAALSLALALGASVLTSVTEAQDAAGKTSAGLTTLTPLDYVEIRQLAARYGGMATPSIRVPTTAMRTPTFSLRAPRSARRPGETT